MQGGGIVVVVVVDLPVRTLNQCQLDTGCAGNEGDGRGTDGRETARTDDGSLQIFDQRILPGTVVVDGAADKGRWVAVVEEVLEEEEQLSPTETRPRDLQRRPAGSGSFC